MKADFVKLLGSLAKPEEGKSHQDTVIKPEEFEKDDDSNYHVDLMHAMGNCRAACYVLDPMDWI